MRIRLCVAIMLVLFTSGLAQAQVDRPDMAPMPTPAELGQTWVEIDGEVYGAVSNSPLGPIGGGPGYAYIITGGDYTVRTPEELMTALAAATAGEIIYLRPDGDFDFTTLLYVNPNLVLNIPEGVTVASNRGYMGSRGAVVCSTNFRTIPLFRAMGPNVRLTGLWLRGPDPFRRLEHHARAFSGADPPGSTYYYLFPVSRGIQTTHDGLHIDNCEISGWSHAGIFLQSGVDHHIHHNYIHHCQYNGLGYGVTHGPAESLIEYNLFDANRHSLAGTGAPGCSYWARHNVELGVSLSHCFDMHGGRDRGDGTDIAGTWIKMDSNTFRAPIRAINIRGVPEWQAEITKNWFRQAFPGSSVVLPYPVGGDTNVLMWDNAYGMPASIARVREEAIAEPGSPPPLYSIVRLTDENWDDKDIFEETDRVYVEIWDRDQVGWGTLTVTMFSYSDDTLNTVVDTETLVLEETGPDTGIYRGSIPLHGALGPAGDGQLNVIAGPYGRPIAVHYICEDHVTDPTFPGPAVDEHLVVGMVIDTRPPSPVNQPSAMQPDTVLTAVSGVHGRTVDLDWTAYDEAIELDVAGYWVYYAAEPFNGTGDAGVQMWASLPPGQQTITVTGLTPDTTYYFAVLAFDEVPNPSPTANVPVATTGVTTADTAPPVLSNPVPPGGVTEVAVDTTISFQATDEGTGLDLDAPDAMEIEVTVSGEPVSTQITATEYPDFWMVQIQPDQPFEWNDQADVSVRVEDRAGNQANLDWSFTVVADTVNPQVTQMSPSDGATGVAVDAAVNFHLTDDKSGVDVNIVDGKIAPGTSRVTVLFDGEDVTGDVNAVEVNGKLDVACSYSPPGGMDYNASHHVSIIVSDVAGNSSGTVESSFDTVVDSTPVAIDQFSPAPDAIGVLLDTSISMRMTDTQSGVVADSIRMWVNDTEVSGQLIKTRDGASVMVEYTPPTAFAHETEVRVRLYVQDRTGNQTDMTYSFTTVPLGTFMIAGNVATAAGGPLAGVTITINGRTATTDGNGAYVVAGLLGGSYAVTPSREEWSFEPASRQVAIDPDDATSVNFVGTLSTYSISGRVVDRSGAGVAGVAIAYGDGSVHTGPDGRYSIPELRRGQYTLTPSLQHHHFDPVNRLVEIAAADLTGVNFVTIADTFSVSGTVRDGNGQPLSGVEVSFAGGSTVTNGSGRYTLSNVARGSHTLKATKAGYKMLPASLQVEVPPDYTGADFTAYSEVTNSFPAGISLVAVPGTPVTVPGTTLNDNPVNVFGTNNVARWDPSATPPGYLRGTDGGSSDFMRVRPGVGYFVRYASPTSIGVAAQLTDPTRTISTGLGVGWNMIGNPFANPTPIGNFRSTITDGVRPYAFVYNNATGSYELVSSKPAIHAVRSTLQPWEGAWMLCVTGGSSLNITSGAVGSAAVAVPEAVNVGNGYLLPVVATAKGRSDTSSVAGVIPGGGAQHTLPNPPTAPATVDVYFVGSDGQMLSRDIREDGSGVQTYQFVVSCSVGPADVSVMLPDLSTVPHRYEVMLTDVAANRTVYARTMPAYTYRATETDSLRHFRLEVRPRSVASLTVSPAVAAQEGDNAVVSYSVSQSCKVSITVRNIAGRGVKTVAVDQPVPAGVQTQVWNLRNEMGARVPAGSYLVEIQAMAEDGQQARGITRINLNR